MGLSKPIAISSLVLTQYCLWVSIIEHRFVSLYCRKHFQHKLLQKQMLKEVSTAAHYQTDTFYITYFLPSPPFCILPLPQLCRSKSKIAFLKSRTESFCLVYCAVLYCTLIQAFEAMHNSESNVEKGLEKTGTEVILTQLPARISVK